MKDDLKNTVIMFGKYFGKTIKSLCEEGEYDYLKYVSTLEFSSKKKHVTECQAQIKVFVQCMEETLYPHREQLKTLVIEATKPIRTCLNYYQIKRGLSCKHTSIFIQNIQESLESGIVPYSTKLREILIDQAAKTKGRRNSNNYKDAFNCFSSILEDITTAEKALLEFTKTL